MMRYFYLLFLLLLVGCQSSPTKIYEKSETKEKSGELISAETVVIDARPPLDFALSHIPGSLNMRWEDFAQKTPPFLGLLEQDLFFHARRLARYGIHPKSKILIVGRGAHGKGEEGRLAWTFRYLGIEDVSTRSIDAFSIPLTRQESLGRESVPMWKPNIDSSLLVEKNEFLKAVMRPRGSQDYPVVIDVRTVAEYLGKDKTSYYSKNAPDLSGVNVPFEEFFNTQGEVSPLIKEKLEAVQITPDKKIYVIDEYGQRSAAVTLALRELGYSRAANFAGGYMQLIKNNQTKESP